MKTTRRNFFAAIIAAIAGRTYVQRKMLVAVDTSMNISDAEISKFAREFDEMYRNVPHIDDFPKIYGPSTPWWKTEGNAARAWNTRFQTPKGETSYGPN